jgi:hypothetical protein
VEWHTGELRSRGPGSEPKLNNPAEIQDAILSLKVGKEPGPNCIPNGVLKYLPQRAISLFVALFKADFVAQNFPSVWKHCESWEGHSFTFFVSSHKSSDTNFKLFEKILLSRILSKLSGLGLLRDEHFGFRPKHSNSLQLARLVKRVTRNFGEKRLKCALFLDVDKAFDAVWVNVLLFKLTVHNFSSHIWLKPYLLTFTTERSRRTSKRPHPPVVSCGLA